MTQKGEEKTKMGSAEPAANDRLATRCARGGQRDDRTGAPLAPAIVPATAFAFADQAAVDRYYESGEGHVYSRYGNPTVEQVEAFLAQLERAQTACLFSS